MILHQMLVKMLRREAGVARAVKRFHLVRTVNRNPLAGCLAQPPVQQTRLAILFVALTPAPERPFTDTQELRRLQLVELQSLVPAQNIQKLHHSHTLKGFRPAHHVPPKGHEITGQIVCYINRTYRVLPTQS